MGYADLEITRDDIDGYEGVTFDAYSGSGSLNLGDRDDHTLDKSKKELKSDILDRTGQYYRDGEYNTESALLDALFEADDEELLKELLTLKFLSLWFFQDAQNEESLSYSKARTYHSKYVRYLEINLGRILSDLSDPKQAPRYRMNHGYG